MSAHPALLRLSLRLVALGRQPLAADLGALGADLATEAPTLRVLERLVARDEALTAAARLAVADFERLGPAGRVALVELRKALRLP